MFNVRKFKAAIALSGLNIQEIAKRMGISTPTLYRKMSGESDFYRNEMLDFCKIVGTKDLMGIFFDPEVTETQQ